VEYGCKSWSVQKCNLLDFFDQVRVCGLMVLKDGKIALEIYRDELPLSSKDVCADLDHPANNATRPYGIASVAKSITSTLLGFALADQARLSNERIDLSSLQKPVDDILTYLASDASAGGYSGVPLDLVLRMRSGAAFNEFGPPHDDDRIYSQVVEPASRTKTFAEFAQEARPKSHGKGRFNYAGLNTAVVALLIQELTGQSLGEYLETKIWKPLGMTEDASWKIDKSGTPAAYCCFEATIPDLARFGQFVLSHGKDATGNQLLPEEWFDVATQRLPQLDDAIPWLNPSHNPGCPLEYRYQWWLFREPRRDFTAVGIAGQFIHVMPDDRVVIVQVSDWGKWDDGDRRECTSFRVHEAIAKALRHP